MEELSQLLQQIQSSNNTLRAAAEARLSGFWLDARDGADRPALLLTSLAQLAAQGAPEQRASAAVIFRRCATRHCLRAAPRNGVSVDVHPVSAFALLSPEQQENIRSILLAGLLTPDQPAFGRRKIGDAIAELVLPSAWPALWPAVSQAASENTDANVREACFRVISAAPSIAPHSTDLHEVTDLLARGFADSSEHVRTSATTAFASFFLHLPRYMWVHFKPLLPALLNVMEPLRQQGQEEELTSVLESLITLAEKAPKMFLPVFAALIEFALTVAADTELDEAPRMTALELVAAFADGAPVMCAREPTYVRSVVPMLLKLLTEVGRDDDEEASEWQNTDDQDAIEEEEAVHSEAKHAVDRLSLSLGGELVAPVLFEYLPLMLNSADWRERLAGLMALSNAAEGCREQMLPNLQTILQAVVPMLQDAHPRVQWSACNALGQLSTDLAPELQQHFGHLVLPGLINRLVQPTTFKVQAHAAAALVNFSESVSKEILDPYLDQLLSNLLELVQSPKRYVQEQALTTIAMVADSSQQYFIKYYDTLMPLVLNILEADLPAEYRLLKAKAIECATLIALAVGKQVFAPHMEQLGRLLLNIQEQSNHALARANNSAGGSGDGDENGSGGATEDDPCAAYLVQSWGRLCRVIGADFAQFLPVVLPPLLETAKVEAKYYPLNVDEAETLMDSDDWEVVKCANGQWIGLHTALYDDKANAIELLHVYPRELGAGFWPFVGEIINDIVLPGLKFFWNINVRIYSCQLVPHLIYVAQLHSEDDAASLWRVVFNAMAQDVLQNEREKPEVISEVFMATHTILEILKTKALTADDMQLLSGSMCAALRAARLRLEKKSSAGAGAGVPGVGAAGGAAGEDEYGQVNEDDEDEDEFEDDDAIDEDLIDASNRLVHSLLKTFGPDLLKTSFADVCALVPEFAASHNTDSRVWAVEVIGDLVEFGKDAAAAVVEQWTRIPLQGLQAADAAPLVQSSCAACIGRIALHGGARAEKVSMDALEPLLALALSPQAAEPENVETRERCCGAIARILRTFGPSALSSEHFALAVGEWLKTLPITHLSDGASYSYLFLAELLEKNHPTVRENYQPVFVAVVAALEARTLSGKPAEYVVSQAKALIAALPEDKRMSLFNSLSVEQQDVVRAVFS